MHADVNSVIRHRKGGTPRNVHMNRDGVLGIMNGNVFVPLSELSDENWVILNYPVLGEPVTVTEAQAQPDRRWMIQCDGEWCEVRNFIGSHRYLGRDGLICLVQPSDVLYEYKAELWLPAVEHFVSIESRIKRMLLECIDIDGLAAKIVALKG